MVSKEHIMQIVEANAGTMEAQLRNWGVKIDKIVAKVTAAGAEARTEYRKRVDDLRAKHAVAQSKFDECKTAGSAKWGLFKTGLEAAWNDLEAAFRKLGRSPVEADLVQPGQGEPPAKAE
jgi:multidrug resistance efflux pump